MSAAVKQKLVAGVLLVAAGFYIKAELSCITSKGDALGGDRPTTVNADRARAAAAAAAATTATPPSQHASS